MSERQELKVAVAVIGAGSAGLNVFRGAQKHTESVVLIEGGPYGTTCARVGCMPSKLLIAAAEAAHDIERAHGFGVHAEPPVINGVEVMDRVRRERDRFVGFVLEDTEAIPEPQRIRGYARFLDDHTLQVDDHTRIHAERIVIATGSTPSTLPMFAGLGERLIINDDVFDWTDLPESIAVFGPGVIGLELGQALHRLGVRMRMFGMSGRFLRALGNSEVQEYALRQFQSEFPLDPGVQGLNVERRGQQVALRFIDRESGKQVEELFDYVLAATGRTPNIKGLALENTTLALDAKGIPEYDATTMRCGKSHIFIAGDVNNDLPLLHEASDEGRIAGENAGRYPQVQPGRRRSPLSVIFSDPQVVVVGESWRALQSRPFIIGRVSFEGQGRSRVMLKNRGLMHVYADPASGHFLGAQIFGPQAEHLGHLLSWAHQQRLTIAQMLEMPFYHPVIEEGLRTALRDADTQVQATPVLLLRKSA
jgi:dihydrolipoamide dehydrogenase